MNNNWALAVAAFYQVGSPADAVIQRRGRQIPTHNTGGERKENVSVTSLSGGDTHGAAAPVVIKKLNAACMDSFIRHHRIKPGSTQVPVGIDSVIWREKERKK